MNDIIMMNTLEVAGLIILAGVICYEWGYSHGFKQANEIRNIHLELSEETKQVILKHNEQMDKIKGIL